MGGRKRGVVLVSVMPMPNYYFSLHHTFYFDNDTQKADVPTWIHIQDASTKVAAFRYTYGDNNTHDKGDQCR